MTRGAAAALPGRRGANYRNQVETPMTALMDRIAAQLAHAHAVLDAPEPQTRPSSVELALARVGQPLTNKELARVLGCHKGTASKRVSRLLGRVYRLRHGRHVAIGLAEHMQANLFAPRAA